MLYPGKRSRDSKESTKLYVIYSLVSGTQTDRLLPTAGLVFMQCVQLLHPHFCFLTFVDRINGVDDMVDGFKPIFLLCFVQFDYIVLTDNSVQA